jgi:hypothetical protein
MDQAFVDRIYNEVGGLNLELERDPTVLGPNYINDIMAKCRNYLNRASSIRLTLNRMRRELMVKIGGEETIFSVEKDHLLAGDETVKRQPNIRDREALVNTLLRDRVNSISALKSELLDLETVEKAVKMVHDELIRTSAEIKTQRQMLFADRVTGAGYGDESDGSSNPPPRPSSIDEDELNNLMRNEVPLVAPAAAPKLAAPKPATVEAPKPVEDEIDLDLQAALASLDSEEVPTPEVEPDADLAALIAETTQEAPKVETPKSAAPASAESDLVDPNDPDLVRFIEAEEAAPPVEAKKAKASKAAPPPPPADSGDFDFSDILSSL